MGGWVGAHNDILHLNVEHCLHRKYLRVSPISMPAIIGLRAPLPTSHPNMSTPAKKSDS